jgi:hypothetical protein
LPGPPWCLLLSRSEIRRILDRGLARAAAAEAFRDATGLAVQDLPLELAIYRRAQEMGLGELKNF